MKYTKSFILILLAVFVGVLSVAQTAHAQLTPITPDSPKSSAYGVEGRISSPPPSQAAHIVAPSGNQTYTNPLISVSGSCLKGLLVEVYSNGVLVGSTMCQSGSFSLQIYLFPGQNELTALVRDNLGQQGPVSNTVIVTYSSASFEAFATAITLTSAYGRRAADPGSELTWPLQLSGGTGPYAFSIDWGDGSAQDLMSQSFAGIVNIKHTYKSAGIYRVTIKVSDHNGANGFLQLIAVANGAASSKIQTGDSNDSNAKTVQTKVLWGPAIVCLALLIPAFWLGRRYEMRALRKKLEHDAQMIQHLNV
jgi:PKD repeat protein